MSNAHKHREIDTKQRWPEIAATLVSGAAFEAVLTAAGVAQPSVILSQLQFGNWHMIKSFIAATASSG